MIQQEFDDLESNLKSILSEFFPYAVVLDEKYGKRILNFGKNNLQIQGDAIEIRKNKMKNSKNMERKIDFRTFFNKVFDYLIHDTRGYILQISEQDEVFGILIHKYRIDGFNVSVMPYLFYKISDMTKKNFLSMSPEEYRNLMRF